MVLNRAVLVKRELGEAQGARMSFRSIGPVPPWNFATPRAVWLGGAA